jgi:hypothetical protein
MRRKVGHFKMSKGSLFECCNQRRINKTEPSVTLLKATSIFPCDVQSQFIEALEKEIGSGKDQSELHSILDRALDKATTVEAAYVKQMTWSERSAFDALSDDDDEEGTETVALLMFRFPCSEQRRILRKRAAYDFTDSCSEASESEVAVPSRSAPVGATRSVRAFAGIPDDF